MQPAAGAAPLAWSPDAAIWARDIDPVLLHAIVSFVRANYPASDPAAGGVMKRLLEFTSSNPVLVGRKAEGAKDPIAEWFEGDHDYSEFRGRGEAMLDLIVDKLES